MTIDKIIDGIDREILNILQVNARVTNTEVARRVRLAPSAVLERIRKLEERGLIEGYTARVNPRALDRGLLAFVFVRTDELRGEQEFARRLASYPEVQEVHNIAGEDCYLVKVRVSSPEALAQLLRERIGAGPTVRSTRTTIVLETLKESTALPIAGVSANGRAARRKTGKGRQKRAGSEE